MGKILKVPIESLSKLNEYIPEDCSQFTAVRIKTKWVISIPKVFYKNAV